MRFQAMGQLDSRAVQPHHGVCLKGLGSSPSAVIFVCVVPQPRCSGTNKLNSKANFETSFSLYRFKG
jgi:hypothetical protein